MNNAVYNTLNYNSLMHNLFKTFIYATYNTLNNNSSMHNYFKYFVYF